jgi:hypothetical protein
MSLSPHDLRHGEVYQEGAEALDVAESLDLEPYLSLSLMLAIYLITT